MDAQSAQKPRPGTVTRALLLLAVVVLGVAATAAADNFETVNFPNLPTGVSASGTVQITTAAAQSGTKSLMLGGSSSATWTIAPSCAVWVSAKAASGPTAQVNFILSSSTTTDSAVFVLAAGNSVSVSTSTNSGTTTATPGMNVLSATTWTQFGIDGCGGAGANCVTFYYIGTTQNSAVVCRSGWSSHAPLNQVTLNSNSGATNTYFDDSSWTGVIGPTVVGASATASVTNLVGFDINPEGTTAIARTDGGDFVRSWAAQGLGSPQFSFDTNCIVVDGVTAADQNIVYKDCNGDDTIVIAGAAGGAPDLPAGCTNADEFDSWNVNGIDESLIVDMTDLGLYSVDWEISDPDNCFASAMLMFSTTDDRVGVLTGTFTDTVGGTQKHVATKTYLSGQQPYICGDGFDGDTGIAGSEFYLLVAASDAATVAYKWNMNVFSPSLSLYNTFGGSLGSSTGLDCSFSNDGNGKTVVGNSNSVRVFGAKDGVQDWARTDLTPLTDGVAISDDGEWVAVTTATATYVLNGTTGATVAQLTTPSGTFKVIKMDSTGQNVWVATTTTIARFQVTTQTTGTPVDTCLTCNPTTTTNTNTGSGTSGVSGSVLVACRYCYFGSNISNAAFIVLGLGVVFGTTGAGVASAKKSSNVAMWALTLGGLAAGFGLVYVFQKGILEVGGIALVVFVPVAALLAYFWFRK